MAPTITVVAEVPPGGRGVPRLVEALDAQSLRTSEFTVLFLVRDAATDIARRLADLAERRPNVSVVHAPDGGSNVALERATGDWIVYLHRDLMRARVQLHPESLARLADFGTTSDCDLVLGRTDVADGALVHDLFVDDAARVSNVAADVAGSAVLAQRRAFVADHGLVVDADSAARALSATDRVGVLATYPCAALDDGPKATQLDALAVASATASWQDGRVVLTATGSVRGAAAARPVRFSVRHTKSGSEFWLPSEGESAADGSFSGRATLDVRAAAAGARLADGVWEVRVGLHAAVGWSPRRAVPATSLASAVVDDVLVAAPSGAKTLTLDVGATRFTAVPAIDPADVRIHESAHGTLMVAALPSLAVSGRSRSVGTVLLDRFALPAALITEGDSARIECYLSGLSGRSALATRFGRAKAAPAGLQLEISPVGAMSVRRAPAGSASAAPDKAPAGSPDSAARRARRRVPARLEPMVQAISRNPTARRIYQRLAGLSG